MDDEKERNTNPTERRRRDKHPSSYQNISASPLLFFSFPILVVKRFWKQKISQMTGVSHLEDAVAAELCSVLPTTATAAAICYHE
jgi:hypothetical protein